MLRWHGQRPNSDWEAHVGGLEYTIIRRIFDPIAEIIESEVNRIFFFYKQQRKPLDQHKYSCEFTPQDKAA